MTVRTFLLLSAFVLYDVSAMMCENSYSDGCHCFTKKTSHWMNDKEKMETTCCCKGLAIDAIPKNLTIEVKHLYMKNVGLTNIDSDNFEIYPDLEVIDIIDAHNLHQINADAFSSLKHLKKLSIKKCSSLRYIEGVLQLNNSGILILSFSHNSLHDLPAIVTHKGSLSLPTIDFSFNEIRMLKSRSFHSVEAHSIDMSHNKIDVIEDYAFLQAKLGLLKMDYNPLRLLAKLSFANTSALRNLSLSHSRIEYLPEEGLERVKKIILSDNPNLKQLPSIFVFTSLEEAHLTYPYHCCLFKHAEVPKKSDSGKYTGNIDELRKKYCQSETSSTDSGVVRDDSEPRSTTFVPLRRKRENEEFATTNTLNWDDFEEEEIKFNAWGDEEKSVDPIDWAIDEEIYESNTTLHLDPINDHVWIPKEVTIKNTQIATFCNSSGIFDVKTYYSKIACYPAPDPLNPCEDVVGFVWLRGVIWFVWIMAIFGNITVMAILCATNQSRMRVNHFLMMNLAFADFCTGVYMAMLAVQDARTAGEYYNFAVDWQTGWGCNLAGFLAVFASELSIFTMVVISFELWYNTKYVFYGGRLRLGVAVLIMAFGWIFSLTMSFLPLLDVFSSYSATSTCLPLKVTAPGDKIYLIVALSINVLGFAYIVTNYFLVYCMVAGTNAPSAQTQDMAIAKRMAVLIGTDFICWAPTIVFGLTAAGNAPLISVSVAKIFLVIFYPINAFMNPFLYVLLTKMIRKDMSRLARKHPWLKKVSVWNRQSGRNSSLWSSYSSSRNGSRTGTKNASMSMTITSWMSNNSLSQSQSNVRNFSLVSTKSVPNDGNMEHSYSEQQSKNESESESNHKVSRRSDIPRRSSMPLSKGRRPSKMFKTRFSEQLESFDESGFREEEEIELGNSDEEPVFEPAPEDNVVKDESYWYKQKKSITKYFTDKLDKTSLIENERKNGQIAAEESKLLALNSNA